MGNGGGCCLGGLLIKRWRVGAGQRVEGTENGKVCTGRKRCRPLKEGVVVQGGTAERKEKKEGTSPRRVTVRNDQ